MFRLLAAFSPSAANAVGGCLLYALGLPLLLVFIGAFILIGTTDLSAHPAGDPYFQSAMTAVIAAAFGIDVAVYLIQVRRKGRL